MKKNSPFTQSFDQLPNSLPIFPLSNVVVMPGGILPLNIFEPRYLNMLKDAIRGDQLIGMIQPRHDELNGDIAELFDVGCAARITRYEETNDGRLEIMLVGLCRFKVDKEISCMRGYRVVVPDWSHYQHDYDDFEDVSQEKILLLNGALRQYFTYKKFNVDWDSFSSVPTEVLLNNLIAQLSFPVQDKQMLMETLDLDTRVKSFCALLEMEKMSDNQSH